MADYEYMYHKYKAKYLELKNNKIGGNFNEDISQIPQQSIDIYNIKSHTKTTKNSVLYIGFHKFLREVFKQFKFAIQDKNVQQNILESVKTVYRTFKLGVTVSTTVITLGQGGDAIPDFIFLGMDTLFLMENLKFLLDAGIVLPYMEKLYNIEWTGNTDKLKEDTLVVLNSVKNNSDSKKIYGEMCYRYISILDSLGAVFGSSITLFIPDDMGVTRVAIESIIINGWKILGRNPFLLLSKIYNFLPQQGRDILSNKEKLVEFISILVGIVKNMFPSNKDTFLKTVKKNVKRYLVINAAYVLLLLVPFGMFIAGPVLTTATILSILATTPLTGELIIKLIDMYIVPYIDLYADVILKSIGLTFIAMIVLQNCN